MKIAVEVIRGVRTALSIFLSIINMSITSSLVAFFLLLIRWFFHKIRIPKTFYNVMWLVLAVRLVFPFSIMSVFSIFNITAHENMDVVPIGEVVTQIQFFDGAVPVQNVIYSDSTLSLILKTAFIVYLIVISFLIIGNAILIVVAKRKLSTAFLIKNEPTFEQCKARFGMNRKMELYKSSYLDSAIIYGVFRPKIIISDKLDLADTNTLEHIFTHELVHIMRFDYLLKLAGRITLAMHWFNPIVWICYSLFERDMEISCDELALGKIQSQDKKDYVMSIINMASVQQNAQMPNIMSFGESKVKSRVTNIIRYKKLSGIKVFIVSAFIVFIGITLTTNPVLSAENYYSPSAVKISEDMSNMLEHKTKTLSVSLEKQDITKIASLSGIDVQVADIAIGAIGSQQYDFVKYQIYPQSEKQCYSYLYFEDDVCLVAVWEWSDRAGDFILSKLFPSKTFENTALLERGSAQNSDAVELIEKLNSFGIVDPFTDPELIPKSTIAAFCIDDVYTDLTRKDELSKDDVYIDASYIADDAKRYFRIDNFSYTFDEEMYDQGKHKYIYEEGRGTKDIADIVDVENEGSKTIITVQTYLDALHTIVDKTVVYTLYKDR